MFLVINMQSLKHRLCVHSMYIIVVLGSVVAGLFLVFIFITEEELVKESVKSQVLKVPRVKPETIYSLSCFYDMPKSDDTFAPIDDRSIFFFEASCIGNLTMLKACAVESAARCHPKRHIYVLFSSGVLNITTKSFIGELLQYKNVKVARLPVREYLNDALLESVLMNDSKKNIRPEDFSNILRMVILNKWGGIFIEDDMIVFRSFESLPKNWIAKQDVGVSPKILAFGTDEIGRSITSEIIKDISKSYASVAEQYTLSDTITKVLKKMCPEEFSNKGIITCKGITIYTRDLFYPIKYTDDVFYIDDSDVDVGNKKVPFTYHHLMKVGDYNSIEETEHQPVLDLASKFCPYVYKRYEYTHTEPVEHTLM